jgi:hypothetical protein
MLGDIVDAGKRATAVMQRIRGLIRNEPLVEESMRATPWR